MPATDGGTPNRAAEPIRVLAAFTLKPALDVIAADYRKKGGDATLIHGPSPGLAQRVENGSCGLVRARLGALTAKRCKAGFRRDIGRVEGDNRGRPDRWWFSFRRPRQWKCDRICQRHFASAHLEPAASLLSGRPLRHSRVTRRWPGPDADRWPYRAGPATLLLAPSRRPLAGSQAL